jgi:hypothetical protein
MKLPAPEQMHAVEKPMRPAWLAVLLNVMVAMKELFEMHLQRGKNPNEIIV